MVLEILYRSCDRRQVQEGEGRTMPPPGHRLYHGLGCPYTPLMVTSALHCARAATLVGRNCTSKDDNDVDYHV